MADRLQWPLARRFFAVLYIGTTLAIVAKTGVPSDREVLVLWVMGLALTQTLGRTMRDALVVVASWVPFVLALFLYDFARSAGYRLHGQQPVSVVPQITLDRWLGGGRLWTERLQDWLVADVAEFRGTAVGKCNVRLRRPSDAVRWYDVAVAVVYTSHFLVPYLIAGYFWRKGERLWRWYTVSFVLTSAIACLIFAIIPTAPPWYAACKGLIEPFPRGLANNGWRKVGFSFASQIIDKGKYQVNLFAAIPSLHSADSLLVSVFAWMVVPKRLRFVMFPLLVAYPMLMGFALVYSGEHYLIDVVTGFGLVALVLTAGWYARKRFRWRSPWVDGPGFEESPPELDGGPHS